MINQYINSGNRDAGYQNEEFDDGREDQYQNHGSATNHSFRGGSNSGQQQQQQNDGYYDEEQGDEMEPTFDLKTEKAFHNFFVMNFVILFVHFLVFLIMYLELQNSKDNVYYTFPYNNGLMPPFTDNYGAIITRYVIVYSPVFSVNPFLWSVLMIGISTLIVMFWMVKWGDFMNAISRFSLWLDEFDNALVFICSTITVGSVYGCYDILTYVLFIGIAIASSIQTTTLHNTTTFMPVRILVIPYFNIVVISVYVLTTLTSVRTDGYAISAFMAYFLYFGIVKPFLTLKYYQRGMSESDGEIDELIERYLNHIRMSQGCSTLFKLTFCWIIAAKFMFNNEYNPPTTT